MASIKEKIAARLGGRLQNLQPLLAGIAWALENVEGDVIKYVEYVLLADTNVDKEMASRGL